MSTFILVGAITFALYQAYMIGRCSAVHDIVLGNICEDLEYWKEIYTEKKE